MGEWTWHVHSMAITTAMSMRGGGKISVQRLTKGGKFSLRQILKTPRSLVPVHNDHSLMDNSVVLQVSVNDCMWQVDEEDVRHYYVHTNGKLCPSNNCNWDCTKTWLWLVCASLIHYTIFYRIQAVNFLIMHRQEVSSVMFATNDKKDLHK